jgi:helix-turn-helix protein
MPPGTLVPRDWLLEQLTDASPGASPLAVAPAPALVDLTIRDLAQMFAKRPSTVRAWVERGDFPGAYKLNGKEWRVPASAVAAFQDHQRHRKPSSGGAETESRLSVWRSVRPPKAPSRSESGPDAATMRPPRGNAKA